MNSLYLKPSYCHLFVATWMSRHKLTKKISATFCKVKSRGSRTARTQGGYQFHHMNSLFLKLSYCHLFVATWMSRHKLTKKINATFYKVKSRGSRTAWTQGGYQFRRKNFLYLKLSYCHLFVATWMSRHKLYFTSMLGVTKVYPASTR